MEKYDLKSSSEAELAAQAITTRDLVVSSVESKPTSRNPFAPFMTSTLQQEAGRKYGMGARQTMQAAQRLYEAGILHICEQTELIWHQKLLPLQEKL